MLGIGVGLGIGFVSIKCLISGFFIGGGRFINFFFGIGFVVGVSGRVGVYEWIFLCFGGVFGLFSERFWGFFGVVF